MDLQELQTLAEREQEILDAPCIRCCTVGAVYLLMPWQ